MDDIFTVFSSNIDFSLFHKFLNELHPNLKFTYELGNSTLPFLDTVISVNGVDFDSWVYRKATNTDLILNYYAVCPKKWKLNLIQNMLNRAWNICSNYENFHNEVVILKDIFMKNAYPAVVFEKAVNSFLNLKFCSEDLLTVKDQKDIGFVLKIPFVGKPSFIFKNKIKKIIFDEFNVNVDTVFISCKVGKYFSLKCCTPLGLISHIVYKFTCFCEETKFYIGKTHRHLSVRAKEHTDLVLGNTVVTNHIRSCDGCQSRNLVFKNRTFENFEIISKCNTKFECIIKEALFIKKFNPPLNKQTQNFEYFFKCI